MGSLRAMPGATPNLVYACDPWEIDLGRRELRSRGTPVVLGQRAFEIVEALALAGGQLLTKDDLMERVWPGAIVGENTLHVHISAVRKVLGPDRGMLKTSSGRGYRLLGGWTVRHDGISEAPPAPKPSGQAPERPPSNLPVIVSELIGRSVAMQRVRDLVSAYRVVTVTGAGGMGKTTLAIKAAHSLLADFEHGVWLVELASLSDAALAPSAVAGVLGLKLGGEQATPESLARAIRDRHLLLVLDNCEHLIDAVTSLVEAVIQLCPRATVLATSREVMRTSGRVGLPRSGARRSHSCAGDTGQHPQVQCCRTVRRPGKGTRRELLAAVGGSRLDRARSAGSSTGFRSPSSSPRPAPRPSEPNRSLQVCAIALRC